MKMKMNGTKAYQELWSWYCYQHRFSLQWMRLATVFGADVLLAQSWHESSHQKPQLITVPHTICTAQYKNL